MGFVFSRMRFSVNTAVFSASLKGQSSAFDGAFSTVDSGNAALPIDSDPVDGVSARLQPKNTAAKRMTWQDRNFMTRTKGTNTFVGLTTKLAVPEGGASYTSPQAYMQTV